MFSFKIFLMPRHTLSGNLMRSPRFWLSYSVYLLCNWMCHLQESDDDKDKGDPSGSGKSKRKKKKKKKPEDENAASHVRVQR